MLTLLNESKPLLSIALIHGTNYFLMHSFKCAIILHGYNASAELTIQLVRHGFYFSIGKAFKETANKTSHPSYTKYFPAI